jgi:hypothetical protein
MTGYTGEIYRGVDYNPTWPGWTQGPGVSDPNLRLQTFDSDMANDAFASLWGKGYQAPPAGDTSAPINNGSNYRDDLKTIAEDGFNLVRLYNWDMSRGTAATQAPNYVGLDHINFLNYAASLGLKVVVPVSDYFLNDDGSSWNGVTPDSSYSFASAPAAIQSDFKQFIASITDPVTGKISTAVQSISVGNEGDIGEDLQVTGTTASNYLARTNWWIYNLHQQINGTAATGPDGNPVVNGASGTLVRLSATFSNADQGGTAAQGAWFNDLLGGVQAGQTTPNGWYQANNQTFATAVSGLATVDPTFASYYYNSFNIGQSTTTSPFSNTIAATLAKYDNGANQSYPEQAWPFFSSSSYQVPLMLMEVFTPNRSDYPTPADQALAAVKEAKDMEAYLALHNGGTPSSTTNLMGYNYFEFNDEPAAGKSVGLYQYGAAFQNAQTGTSALFYVTNSSKGFPDFTLPVYALTATAGPNGQGTLAGAWTANFPQFLTTHNDAYVVLQGHALTAAAPIGVMGNDESESAGAVALQSGTAHGQLGLGADGAVAYTANAGFTGIDTFSYYAFGEYGASDSSHAAIVVVPVSVGATTTVNLLALTPGELVAATYAAYLGRAPDAAGYEFWVGEYNKMVPPGAPAPALAAIAHSFGVSAEAKALYPFLAHPAGASDAEIAAFVSSVYDSLFNRPSDAAGSAYWAGQIKQALQAGQSVDAVVVNIMSGAQETAAAKDITTMMSRVAVSQEYVYQQELHNTVWAGASDIAAATTLLHSVNADPQSLLVGMRNAEDLIVHHP